MKTILIVFSIIACNIAFTQNTTVLEEDSIAVVVDELAEFPGGRSELVKFLGKEIKYPQKAIENNISGRVYLKFNVEKDGQITKIGIARGMANCPECEQEAIRVVRLMPKWNPAIQNGQFVSSYYVLPINFQLQ